MTDEQHSERDQMPEEERDPAQAPKPGATAPKSAATAPKSSATAPKSSATAPKSGDPQRRGRLRRWVRGKPAVAVVGAVVGALLAGGTMAWRAGELPLLPRDMCWGSLSSGTVDRLFSDGDIRAKETPLESALSRERRASECRLQRWEDDELKWEISAEVRDLDSFQAWDAREWTHEFLSPTMAPLGGETPGMVSATRAWVALPASCTGGRAGHEPPTVVSLSSGSLESHEDDAAEERGYRAAMADAVVELTNGVLAEKGCKGRFPDPGELPRTKQPKVLDEHGTAELCGLKGTRLPSWMKGSGDYPRAMRSTPGTSGPAHSCEYGRNFALDATRFTTIEDPRLAHLVEPLARRSPVRFRGDGYGTVSGDLSVYMAKCQTGEVAFLAQEEDFYEEHAATIELLPSYVAAEAKRIGCGKVKVTGPKLTS
ncbi:hypothetical protein [Streptomyces sp. 3N207]|uniref:hypothetical protein n=1 Tax=Streptomyces sp. 3N207 TaxID=3457417 RepID=UPI003FD1C32C